jgi:hypothetical protein
VCGMDRSSNSFFLMVLPFSKNYSLILWIFTYEPLKFWENFVSHPSLFKKHPSNFVKKFESPDEPLNFRKNYVCNPHCAKIRTSDFTTIHLKDPDFIRKKTISHKPQNTQNLLKQPFF